MSFSMQTFPINMALTAMGPSAERYKQHRAKGQILALADADKREHAKPQGWGRGAQVHLSVYAILQGAIALRAIDCGVEVERAYTIGSSVVWSALTGLANTDSKWGQRLPGPAFKEGQTWIAISQHAASPDAPNFVVLSDADPMFGDKKLSPFQIMEALLPDVFNGSPFIMMSLNGIWDEIAAVLDLSPEAIREGLD